MYNLHLLQKDLTIEEYETLEITAPRYNPAWQRLPTYVIARCPYCSTPYLEKLDTYTLREWRKTISFVSEHEVFLRQLVIQRCKHFALTQIFFNFHLQGKLPDEVKGHIGGEKPYVIGHLLENNQCLAVIHTLPVCRIENDAFLPRYTLFMASYFSENPPAAIHQVEEYNQDWYNIGESSLFLPLQFGEKYWADLPHWVAKGQLYWVDGIDPELNIHTHDVDTFPYGNLTD